MLAPVGEGQSPEAPLWRWGKAPCKLRCSGTLEQARVTGKEPSRCLSPCRRRRITAIWLRLPAGSLPPSWLWEATRQGKGGRSSSRVRLSLHVRRAEHLRCGAPGWVSSGRCAGTSKWMLSFPSWGGREEAPVGEKEALTACPAGDCGHGPLPEAVSLWGN